MAELDNDMIVDNPLKDIMDDVDITYQKILNLLIDSKQNLQLKTQIDKPKELASLVSIAYTLKLYKYTKSYKTIMDFIKTYLEYMVSYKRLGRLEIIRALTPIESKRDTNLNNPIIID